jgi:outer membrane immunogenic protein
MKVRQVSTPGRYADGGNVSIVFEQNWLASVRARLGYAVDDVLFYGTAGWAISNIDYGVTVPSDTFSDSLTHNGWTAGAGAELAVTDQLTARLEYRYTDFGAEALTVGTESLQIEPHTHAVRAGLSWRF